MQVRLDPAKFDAMLRVTTALAARSAQLRDTLMDWQGSAQAAARPLVAIPGQQQDDPRAIAAAIQNATAQLTAATAGACEGFIGLVEVKPAAEHANGRLKITEGT